MTEYLVMCFKCVALGGIVYQWIQLFMWLVKIAYIGVSFVYYTCLFLLWDPTNLSMHRKVWSISNVTMYGYNFEQIDWYSGRVVLTGDLEVELTYERMPCTLYF